MGKLHAVKALSRIGDKQLVLHVKVRPSLLMTGLDYAHETDLHTSILHNLKPQKEHEVERKGAASFTLRE